MSGFPSKYNHIVQSSMIASAAVGVPGDMVLRVDVASMSGIWTEMIVQISEKSGNRISANQAAKFVSVIGTGIIGYTTGNMMFSKIEAWSGVPIVPAMGINAFMNGLYTYRLGKAVANQFSCYAFDVAYAANIASATIPALLGVPEPSEAQEVMLVIAG